MKQDAQDKDTQGNSEIYDAFIFKPAMEMFSMFKEQAGSAPDSYANLMHMGTRFWGKMLEGMAEHSQTSHGGETWQEGSPDFTGAVKNLYDMWTASYDETLGRFLKIPPVGPAREYTEKIQHSLDTFIQYQAANVELQRALCVPLVESMKQIASDLQHADGGELEKKELKALQQEWIKVCEDRFLLTLRSPEFSRVLAKSMDKTLDFWNASRETMEDYLKFFPVATSSEMEEVHRELYELKKTVKELRSEVKELRKAAPAAQKAAPAAETTAPPAGAQKAAPAAQKTGAQKTKPGRPRKK